MTNSNRTGNGEAQSARRIAQYAAVRHLSSDAAAVVMGISRDAVRAFRRKHTEIAYRASQTAAVAQSLPSASPHSTAGDLALGGAKKTVRRFHVQEGRPNKVTLLAMPELRTV